MDAFNYDLKEELCTSKANLNEGTELFKQIFGYSSKSFIAPCYIWGSELEKEFVKNEIEYLQGSKLQLLPRKAEGTDIGESLSIAHQLHCAGFRTIIATPHVTESRDFLTCQEILDAIKKQI